MERKKVVVIGGGTGSFTVLRGLKNYPLDITAVVTMFDSGGSSGVLRDEFGILPPGDARRCLVALSDGEKEEMLRNLFNYRFNNNGSSLHGHSFGNLFLAALTNIVGNEAQAIKEAGNILNIKGQVLPVSLGKSQLCAELETGEIIEGETHIDIPKHEGSLKIRKVFLKPDVSIYPETEKAIKLADIIIIAPGDLYTSIIPNILVKGVAEALQKSPAKIIYVLNLITKWGETHGFVGSDFAREVLSYISLSRFHSIIYNTHPVPAKLLEAYAAEKKYPVLIDDKLKDYAETLIPADVFSDDDPYLRHDSDKLAAVLANI
ncbi:MAG: gluconeogenesis factor YvcK family protein [Patescibacteria group bacterium]